MPRRKKKKKLFYLGMKNNGKHLAEESNKKKIKKEAETLQKKKIEEIKKQNKIEEKQKKNEEKERIKRIENKNKEIQKNKKKETKEEIKNNKYTNSKNNNEVFDFNEEVVKERKQNTASNIKSKTKKKTQKKKRKISLIMKCTTIIIILIGVIGFAMTSNNFAVKEIIVEGKYIINNADTMTEEAQNCLLKTLEEPPEFVTIILISSNDNLILNTIKSRCMTIKFNNISKDLMIKYMQENLPEAQFSNTLLSYVNGSIGKALEIKDNITKYNEIESYLKKVTSLDIVDFLYYGKIIYDKEDINNILNYMIVCLYSNSKDNAKYIYTIEHVNKCSLRLKSNSNFDMCIDNMLMGIWEEMNENSYRS